MTSELNAQDKVNKKSKDKFQYTMIHKVHLRTYQITDTLYTIQTFIIKK
jgi:hypothetical protein